MQGVYIICIRGFSQDEKNPCLELRISSYCLWRLCKVHQLKFIQLILNFGKIQESFCFTSLKSRIQKHSFIRNSETGQCGFSCAVKLLPLLHILWKISMGFWH